MLARSSEHRSQGRYQYLWLTISNCYHTQSQQKKKKLLIALPRVRTKAAQNGFYYQSAMIYKSLTRDIRMQKMKIFKKKDCVILTFRIFISLVSLIAILISDCFVYSVYFSKLEILILFIRFWNLIMPPILIFLFHFLPENNIYIYVYIRERWEIGAFQI